MISYIMKKIIGSRNEREIKKLSEMVTPINRYEQELIQAPTDYLSAKTTEFKEIISNELSQYDEQDEDNYFSKLGDILWGILPEAFAIIREASRRTLGMRHFDVQMIGGIVLHQGKIAEMKTGEGKTLVAALPLYLNGITGYGSHLVTVNDYLARRDAMWMGPIYKLLAIKVGVINHEASYLVEWEDPERAGEAAKKSLAVWQGEVDGADIPSERNLDAFAAFQTKLIECTRTDAYRAEVTYGTNNEFGFDYLRDNMKFSLDDYVQGEHNFCIVDEVDSILIDEARTPLIISGASEDSTEMYYEVDKHIRNLRKDADFTIDEKAKQTTLTETGSSKIEGMLGVTNIYDPTSLEMLHHVQQALRAHNLFERDVDYIVKDNQVVIVDEFTGRLMPGRRWSDGLHQAVEAKEGVEIENENQTFATITIQNYFRMYKKLSGMTGTADTEALEFTKIYDLDVVVIPTNKPLIREEYNDLIYRTEREKLGAVVEDIKELHERGRPVLVGTASIENSEKVSKLLTKLKIEHQVLNAKHHEKEAEIVAQAGSLGSVTIATNMAGRGTDIILGGNPEFLAREIVRKRYNKDIYEVEPEQYESAMIDAKELCDEEKKRVIEMGGLHILGTERHEARRIDNQLRGRTGRQGDPGSSRFYVALEDDLMRIFASERIASVMDKLGWEEGEPIENKIITKTIENAQKKVEGRNFDIRKHLLEYDDVLNTQRDVVYTRRKEFLAGGDNLKENLLEMVGSIVEEYVYENIARSNGSSDVDSLAQLDESVFRTFNLHIDPDGINGDQKDSAELVEALHSQISTFYDEKEGEIGAENLRQIERYIMLQTIDFLWKDHLLSMDHLREGIGLLGYAQKDPLYEYKKQGYEMFQEIMARFNEEVCEKMFRVQPVSETDMELLEHRRRKAEQQRMIQSRGEGEEKKKPVRRGRKIGRNEPCPCGSGKKYKKCHGRT
ncbi:MAG: preprotein translocase subunit SecA [Thermodesulfobacteriota bacterium]